MQPEIHTETLSINSNQSLPNHNEKSSQPESSNATVDFVEDPLDSHQHQIRGSWSILDNNTIPSVDRNVTEFLASLPQNVQFSNDEGQREGTPTVFAVKSNSLVSGRWNDDHGCCSGRWWDVHRRPNPQIFWDGTPLGTRSIVIIADNIDENAQIHWLVVNIDPRENEFSMGKSGRCNWWQMYYHRCPRGRIPAAALELPNRWAQWRFTSFCPPKNEDHRFRIRVFAQSEWDQSYLDIRHTGAYWNPISRSSDDIVRQLMPTNLAYATIIGKFQRSHQCGGPRYKDGGPAREIEGLVADYDFHTKTMFSMVEGAAPIVDLGASCGKAGRFVSESVRGRHSTVFDFTSGNGLKIPDVDLLVHTGEEDMMEYTLTMDVKMRSMCWTRMLMTNAGYTSSRTKEGVYLCYGLYLNPDGAYTGGVRRNEWSHLVISTKAVDRSYAMWVNGKKLAQGKVKDPIKYKYMLGLRKGPQDEELRKQPNMRPFLSLFNDCGEKCFCDEGGGMNSGGRVKRVQLYDKMLNDEDVELLYTRAVYKDMEYDDQE